jgi:hypothetical protein
MDKRHGTIILTCIKFILKRRYFKSKSPNFYRIFSTFQNRNIDEFISNFFNIPKFKNYNIDSRSTGRRRATSRTSRRPSTFATRSPFCPKTLSKKFQFARKLCPKNSNLSENFFRKLSPKNSNLSEISQFVRKTFSVNSVRKIQICPKYPNLSEISQLLRKIQLVRKIPFCPKSFRKFLSY